MEKIKYYRGHLSEGNEEDCLKGLTENPNAPGLAQITDEICFIGFDAEIRRCWNPVQSCRIIGEKIPFNQAIHSA